jgi:CheY-like chemotaxis protein
MTRLILAVSPDPNLLDQLAAHLQEGGRFQVFEVTSGKEALALAGCHNFDLAILDAEINDLPFLPLTRELIALLPRLHILIFPPQNNPHHPLLTSVLCNGYLNKPFFGPEVNEKIQRALADPHTLGMPARPENHITREWVEHPESGLKQIEQLLASTSASAGLLLYQRQVVAATGALTDETGQNILNFLTRYWSNIQSGELFRYLKMDNDLRTYLVYAVPLFSEIALALVYHSDLPLIEVRKEVSTVRKAFLDRYADIRQLRMDFSLEATPQPTQPSSVPEPQREEETPQPAGIDPIAPPQAEVTEPINEVMNNAVTAFSLEAEAEESDSGDELDEGLELDEQQLAQLDSLLNEMPPPDPEDEIAAGITLPLEPSEWVAPPAEAPTPFSKPYPGRTQPLSESSLEEELNPPAELEATHEPASTDNFAFPNFDFSLPWEKKDPAEEGEDFFTPDETASWMPATDAEALTQVQILLLPRNPQQFITHDLANLLNRQLPRLHQVNGWQCIGLTIRPLYLALSVILPAGTNLPDMVQEIKESANIQIFAAFPGLLQSHLDGDFWAPGYYSVIGVDPIPMQAINHFIAQTRQENVS